MKRHPYVLAIAVLLGAGLAALATATARSGTLPVISASPSSEVVDGMAKLGYLLTDAPGDGAGLSAASLGDAILVVDTNLASGVNPSHVSIAYLRDQSAQKGAEDGTGASDASRVVYVLVYDVTLYPMGARGPDGKAPEGMLPHHELVALVDAATGEFLLAVTFR